jgi:hypothetical protein
MLKTLNKETGREGRGLKELFENQGGLNKDYNQSSV